MDSTDQIYSQPFFTEEENSPLGESRKRRYEYSDEDNQSQSLLAPKNRIIHADKPALDQKTHKTKEDAANSSDCKKTKSSEHSSAKSEEETTSNGNQCVFCTFDKDLDKRNYFFGNLLIGELQFLPPCMRSEAYINILKYVDGLKHQHREKSN